MNICRHLCGALFASLATLVLCSCGAPGPPLPPSLELAKTVTDLQASRKGSKVFLSWTVPSETTDFQLVRHLGITRICRDPRAATNQCGTIAGVVQPPQPISRSVRGRKKPEIKPVRASSIDTLPENLQQENPTGFANYAVETLNTNGRSAGLSNLVPVPLAPTLAAPSDLAATVSDQGVTLTWTGSRLPPEIPGISFFYRIYRTPKGTTSASVAGELPITDPPQFKFVDHAAGWQATYQYRITAVTVIPGQPTAIQIEGNDSAPVELLVKDIYPPAVPSGLQAVFSGVGQQPFVDLTWAPVTAADLAGYNVYRREKGGEPVKINAEPVPSPAFRDAQVESGKSYFYSVSAQDVRKNESARSDETTETVP
jgi:hypothetical protein